MESLTDLLPDFDLAREGELLHRTVGELYPLCRSITGHGLRESLRRLQKFVPVTMTEVATGTPVLDWTVPREWNVREAHITDASGRRLVDFQRHNLHLLNYSVPFRGRLSLTALRPHLYSLPEHPDWIPYRTSYYRDHWGFCLSDNQLRALPDGDYEVCIDTSLTEGSLTLAEFVVPGTSTHEILLSAHSCHPSLANDNLSAMVIAARLAQILQGRPLHNSYRFLWAPGTIGAITWLALRREQLANIRGGLVLSCLGDPGGFHYKPSRRENSQSDLLLEHVLSRSGQGHRIEAFEPLGYDERQFCSPGFDLPIGRLCRTPNGRYLEYHTSADNLDFVRPEALAGSLHLLLQVVEGWETNGVYRSLAPYGEPQLGRRGLYRATGGTSGSQDEAAMLWVLNQADGTKSLVETARRSGLALPVLGAAARRLVQAGLLEENPGVRL